MKKYLKSFFVPLILATICGFVSARIVFDVYQKSITDYLTSSKIYLLQNGEYNTYEEMRQQNLGNNYVYYEDNQKYKSIVGITKEANNISKIQNIYQTDLVVEEYYISSNLINNKQLSYDEQLSKTNDPKEVRKVVKEILNLYQEDKETIELILTK